MVANNFSRISPIKLTLQISSILRKVRLIILGMAGSAMQILIAPLVTSGYWQLWLLNHMVYLWSHVSDARTAATSNQAFSLVLLA